MASFLPSLARLGYNLTKKEIPFCTAGAASLSARATMEAKEDDAGRLKE